MGGKRTAVVAIVWPLAAVLLVALGRGSDGQIVPVIMATLAGVGCWSVGGLLLLSAWWAPSRKRMGPGRTALAIGTLLLGLSATLPFGSMLHRRDVAEAEAFCEGLIPAIERSRAETGRYPDTAPGIEAPSPGPD